MIKNSPANTVDLGSILGSGRSPGEEKGYPLQYSGVENSMDCIDHGVTKSQTQLSDFPFHFQSAPMVLANPVQPLLWTSSFFCGFPFTLLNKTKTSWCRRHFVSRCLVYASCVHFSPTLPYL